MSNAASKLGFPITTGLFLVVLRVAIGWHFFYEGVDKFTSDQPGRTAFTAEHYIRASQGPFRPFFTGLIPDFDSLNQISDIRVYDDLADLHSKVVLHYRMDDEQQKSLVEQRDRYQKKAKEIFDDPEYQSRLGDYKAFLKRVNDDEARIMGCPVATADDSPDGGAFPRERLDTDRSRVNTDRIQLLAAMNKPIIDYENKVERTLTAKQKLMGPPATERRATYWLDQGMIYGLLIVGASLMLGVFTRLGCFGGILLLASFYLSMPPWPGLIAPPNTEGHYLFVNKNLIELLALLMIMTTASGRWFGFDGWIRRFIIGPIFGHRAAPPPLPPKLPAAQAAADQATSEKVQGRIQSTQNSNATPVST